MRSAWQLRHRTIARALAALATAASFGCSLLYDLNADQCDSDSDCKRFGARVCQSGVCVADDSNTPGGQPSGEAGSSAAGASEPPVECADNGECIDDHFGEPYLCRQGQCISLTTKECPLVVGVENLRAPEPIVFGAYTLAPDAVSRSVVMRNIELVVSEITNKVTGLRGGPGGSDRTLAFVVCNSYFPDVAPGTIDAFVPSLDHLVGTLQVPGILSALSAKDLQAVFKQRLDAAGTFVISPYEQDSELASLSDDSRLWHMLGATSDLAPAFVPLLLRTETYLRRDESFLNISGPGGKLRVALVAANVARELDIRDALLEFPELAGFEVEPFLLESALLNADPDISSTINGILDFAPNIIIALTGSEFIEKGFPVLESGTTWTDRTFGQQRPMYLLGSTMAPQTWALYGTKQGEVGGWKTFFDRVVGVAYASAEDPRLLRSYEARLIAAHDDVPDPSLLLGSESVYDAAYLLIYATAAAGDLPQPRGKDLAAGMRRLVEGTTYDVGPADISDVLTALDNGGDIGLNLTLGPADWNIARGTRNGMGSVYCFGNFNSGMEPQGPVADALRYDPETGELENKALICIPDF
jgi:hypothetical protein